MNEYPEASTEGPRKPVFADTDGTKETRAHRAQRYVINGCLLFWFLVIRWVIYYLAVDWKLFPALVPGLLPLCLIWWACTRGIGVASRDRSLRHAWWSISLGTVVGLTCGVQAIYHYWPWEKQPGLTYSYNAPATSLPPVATPVLPPTEAPQVEVPRVESPSTEAASDAKFLDDFKKVQERIEKKEKTAPPTSDSPPAAPEPPERDAPVVEATTPAPAAARAAKRRTRAVRGGLYAGSLGGHWVQSVGDGGRVVVLEDGSVWEISGPDQVDTSLWLATDDITITEDSTGPYDYKLVHTEDGETAEARLLRQ